MLLQIDVCFIKQENRMPGRSDVQDLDQLLFQFVDLEDVQPD